MLHIKRSGKNEIRRSNSLGDEKESEVKSPTKTLLNDSESSNNIASFNEPLLKNN